MTKPKTRLLLIDDDIGIRRFLRASLDTADFELLEAGDGSSGLQLVASANPAIVLLDLGLPDMDGVDVARQLRSWTSVHIIVLSARGQERDKIAALDAGADDYLTKPFGVGEPMARIRAALRKAPSEEPQPVLEVASLRIDLAARQVFRDGREVRLTPNEYKILAHLVRNAGRVVTHSQLLSEVWGPAYAGETQYLRVYMGQLRHKLEDEPAQPRLFVNEPGIGYRLKLE